MATDIRQLLPGDIFDGLLAASSPSTGNPFLTASALTTFTANRILVSNGSGAITAHTAQTTNQIAFYDINGLPTGSTSFVFQSIGLLGKNPTIHTSGTKATALMLVGDGSAGLDISGILFWDSTVSTAFAVEANLATNIFKIYKDGEFIVNGIGQVGIQVNGGTFGSTALLNIADNADDLAHINLKVGTAPSVPVDGDMWHNATSLFFRKGAVTHDLLAIPAGGITSLNSLTAASQTFVNDTNVTIVSAGSTHTITWASTLAIARGGTGASSFSGNRIIASDAGGTALTALSAQTANQIAYYDANGLPTGSTVFALEDVDSLGFNPTIRTNGSGSIPLLNIVGDDGAAGNQNGIQFKDNGTAFFNIIYDWSSGAGAETLTIGADGGSAILITAQGAIHNVVDYNGLVITYNTGVITTGTWNGSTIGVAYGGTGQTVYAVGDLLYASATNILSKRTIGTANQYLKVVGGVPTWANGVSPVAQTYTVTNVTTDRTYNANLTNVGELADVLGTLIADLQTSGVIL